MGVPRHLTSPKESSSMTFDLRMLLGNLTKNYVKCVFFKSNFQYLPVFFVMSKNQILTPLERNGLK